MRQALVDAGVNIENLVQADVCGMSLTDRDRRPNPRAGCGSAEC